MKLGNVSSILCEGSLSCSYILFPFLQDATRSAGLTEDFIMISSVGSAGFSLARYVTQFRKLCSVSYFEIYVTIFRKRNRCLFCVVFCSAFSVSGLLN